MTVIFARAKFLIPMTTREGRLVRISDGYILADQRIMQVGRFTPEIGKNIITKYTSDLKVLGNESTTVDKVEDLVQLNGVILPGFVKGHGHDHESVLIGVARDEPLTAWLDKAVNIFTGMLHEKEGELRDLLGKSPYLIAYLKARMDDIQFGITSAMTHHCNFNKYHVKELVEANEQAGTRIYIAVGSQDRNYDTRILDSPEQAVSRLNEYEDQFGHLKRTIIIPGPDQLFSNGPELLKALKKWAIDHDKIIHIHSSEEPATTRWFTEKYGMSPVKYAESIGFLDSNTILAHQVNTTDKDLELLARTGAKVVHNPLANTILGSGMPRVLDMMKKGISLCISTDGSGSADNQNILSAARLASQYQKALRQDAKVMNSEQVLQKITIDAAEVLGLNAGSLEVDKDGDFVVFDLDYPNVTPTRLETVVENLIWASSGNEIRYVVANGEILLDDYEFTTINRSEVLNDIVNLSIIFDEHKRDHIEKSETGVRGSEE